MTSIAGVIVQIRKVANVEDSKNIHHAIADRVAGKKEPGYARYSNRYGFVCTFQIHQFGYTVQPHKALQILGQVGETYLPIVARGRPPPFQQ